MSWAALDRWIVFSLLYVLLLAAGIYLAPDATSAFRVVDQLNHQPVRSLTDRSPGPGWYHGKLDAATSATPRGKKATLWVARNTASVSEDSTISCTAQNIPDLELVDHDHRIKLMPPRDVIDTWLAMDLENAKTIDPPRDRLTDCSMGTGSPLGYYEVAIAPGKEVWISGCVEHEVLGPCHGAYSGLTTGTRNELTAKLARSVLGTNSKHAFWGLFLFWALALIVGDVFKTPKRRAIKR